MANSPSDLSIILVVAEQLRVPELKYRVDHAESLDAAIAQFFEGCHCEAGSVTNQSIVKRVLAEFDDTSLPLSFNNLAFIADRLFDVWLRKNKLAQEINDVIGSWRFAFFESLYTQRNQATLDAFVALLEKLAADNFGWCPFPLRSRPILITQLAEMSAALVNAAEINQPLIVELTASWQEFERLQRQKYQRTTERLIALERNLAGSRYAQSQAQMLINNRFNQRLITVCLQLFLQDHWLQLVAKAFELTQTPELLERVRTLTNQMVLVFCSNRKSKSEAAFRYGDMLLDQLAVLFEELRMNKVPDALWRDLEQDIMAILQNQPITEKPYLKLTCYEPIQSFESNLKTLAQQGQWFSCLANNAEHRVCAVAIMEDSKHILFSNYLGIKSVNFGFGEFEQELRAGRFKLLQSEASFSQVIDTTISGLSKVAVSQQNARLMGAEKAKNEAEKLLTQKLLVDQQSKQKAAEIALQTKNIQLKQAEKQRIRQENEHFDMVAKLKLGAWISIISEQSKQQLKLAVKLVVAGKLIFVDKHGIKKLECSQADLVQGIITERIEILSDGAEFDKHLEQALKRIRLLK